jgi:hypothetical protein
MKKNIKVLEDAVGLIRNIYSLTCMTKLKPDLL